MEYKAEEKSAPSREKVEVLGATFEEGKPEGEELGRWRQKLRNREERLRYLQTGERYWYGKDWFGSEKRKNPA
ncbi:hypothetical protein ES703_50109 [subsurface metagenome]